MESFIVAVNAVLPFLIYIAFGMGIRITGIADDELMRRMNQVVFRAFFPVMMFYNLYHKDPELKLNGMMVVCAMTSLFVLIGLLILLVPCFVKENPRKGTIIQAIYRSNFVLFAVPLTSHIFGEQGAVLASMMVAFVVPVYNFTAVVILEYYGGGKADIISVVKRVLSNPMIMGALAGLLFYLLHIRLPDCIEEPVSQFADLTTPLALFILGGTLRFSSMKRNLKPLLAVAGIKLFLLPALILPVTVLLHFTPMERFVLFAMYATPAATASYPMAQNMGCDGDLAGEMVVLTTACSVFSIFLWVFFMRSAGLI